MIVYKITLSVEGDALKPNSIINKLTGELVVANSFGPTDTYVKQNRICQYNYGWLAFMHPKNICSEAIELEDYENAIISFLKKNLEAFKNNGVIEINILYEVYFTGDNFNIDVFNEKQIRILSECGATLSFSGYQMAEKEIIDSFDLQSK